MDLSIGRQLRRAREAKALTLEDVAKATRIRVYYLQALEEDNLQALPSLAQARGFLRAYADYLKIEAGAPIAEIADKTPSAPNDIQPERRAAPPPREMDTSAGAQHFKEVGISLRRQRELLGLSLEDVERHTHLRRHYLAALESGNLKGLPSPVQGRGMLSNYASFLGMDPEQLLLRYADGLQAQLAERQSAEPQTRPAPVHRSSGVANPLRRFLSGDILIGGALALLLAAFVVWSTVRIYAARTDQPPTLTAPSIADVLLATPSPTATTTRLPASLTPAEVQKLPTFPAATDELTGGTLAPGSQVGVQITVNVLQRTYMKVIVDGKVEFDGRVIPGSAYPFSGDSQVEILTGNAAALQVIFNQVDKGPLGGIGQIVDQVFTRQGIFTPTATVTFTPTTTPKFTAAPKGSATPNAPASAIAPATSAVKQTVPPLP
jgi:cytoskeletal protein RodZ